MKTYTLLMVSLFAVLLVGAGCATAETTTDSSNTATTVETGAEEETTYTLAEVAEHATEDDCWLVIRDEVYDVTEYIPGHPGGDQILLGCGQDATSMFEEKPATGTPHSAVAEGKLPTYKIGDLAK